MTLSSVLVLAWGFASSPSPPRYRDPKFRCFSHEGGAGQDKEVLRLSLVLANQMLDLFEKVFESLNSFCA